MTGEILPQTAYIAYIFELDHLSDLRGIICCFKSDNSPTTEILSCISASFLSSFIPLSGGNLITLTATRQYEITRAKTTSICSESLSVFAVVFFFEIYMRIRPVHMAGFPAFGSPTLGLCDNDLFITKLISSSIFQHIFFPSVFYKNYVMSINFGPF